MLISTKGRYALRVMLELAQGEPGECMPLPVIAQRQGISEKYLESIIAVLARAGLVEGQRGKGGGYRLSRELKDYSVGEIVRLTEGLACARFLSGGGEHLPARGQVSLAARLGEARHAHQRLSRQRFARRPAGRGRRERLRHLSRGEACRRAIR